MKTDNAERFERLLAALERELIEATDEEILAAANDLGMSPMMKGSATFFGVTTLPRPPFWPGRRGEAGESAESPDAPHPRRRSKNDPPS